MDSLFRDIAYARRVLFRSPSFALVAILTLAIGIGANTAIFSLLDATLLRPLPYRQANRIVALSEANRNGEDVMISWPDFLDWRAQTKSFSAISAIGGMNFNLTGRGQAERLHGLRVSASFLSVLGERPWLGRDFGDRDDQPGAAPAALLSNELWRRRFGGDPTIVGQTINLDGRAFSVIGVLGPAFRFVYARDVYIPIGLNADTNQMPERGVRSVARVIARLKPGASMQAAANELQIVGNRLARAYPEADGGIRPTIRQFAELVAAPARHGLLTLAMAVGLLLWIACANVAGLLLSRASGRQKEIAIRVAVGADRMRLVSQLLTESGLLAFAGACLGCVLASAILPLLTLLIPMDQGEMEQYIRPSLNPVVLGFTILLAAFVTLLFGLVPALRMAPAQANPLQTGTRATSSPLSFRNALVAGQIALAVVLLSGAGLLGQSLVRLRNTNIGFQADHLLTLRLKLPYARYPDTVSRSVFFGKLMDRLDAIPGVVAASAATCLPFAGKDCWPSVLRIEGRPNAGPENLLHAHFNAVEPGYLATMKIPLLSGRDLTERDDLQSESVVLVNKSFVRRFFGGKDPAGERILEGFGPNKNFYRIVGVVGDARRDAPDIAPVPEVFLPLTQVGPDAVEVVIRTALAKPLLLAPEIMRISRNLDPDMPLYDLRTMDWYFNYQTANRRFPTFLLGAFAGIAMLLASIGLYGLISHIVGQTTKDLGIRIALGAQKKDVVGMVMKQGLSLVAAGLVVGLSGAWAATRFISAFLFGTGPNEGLTLIAVSCLLAAVGALACWLPARRVAAVDPAVSLRMD